MKLQGLTIIILCMAVHCYAQKPQYRLMGRLEAPGWQFQRANSGSSRAGNVAYQRQFANGNDGTYLLAGGTSFDINTRFGVKRSQVYSVGRRVHALDWQTGTGFNTKSKSGFIYNNQLVEMTTYLGYTTGGAQVYAGGGDWVGGNGSPLPGSGLSGFASIGTAANPVTGERIQFARFNYNKFIGSNEENMLLFMSSQLPIEGTIGGDHAVYTVQNGITKFLGIGFAHDLNDQGDVLITDAISRPRVVDRNGKVRMLAQDDPYKPSVIEAQIDNFGRVMIAANDPGNVRAHITSGDRWYRLDDCVDQIPAELGGSIGYASMDPVTGYLYTGDGYYYAPVPEPGTLAALGLGLAALARRRRKG